MLEQRIQQHFIDSADLKYQSAPDLARPIADAVQAMLACITNGGKVLACGDGPSIAYALQFVAFCLGGFERERPELAAVALSSDAGLLTTLGHTADHSPQFARQVRALGQVGDLLLVWCISGDDPSVLAAIDSAHERDMTIVAISGRTGGALASALRETDVLICAPHDRAARVREVHTLVLNCLCDGIDAQLFGEPETCE